MKSFLLVWNTKSWVSETLMCPLVSLPVVCFWFMGPEKWPFLLVLKLYLLTYINLESIGNIQLEYPGSIWFWSQRELEIDSMPIVIKQNYLFSQQSCEVLITKFTDQRFSEWGKYKLKESPELNSKVLFCCWLQFLALSLWRLQSSMRGR